MILTNIIKGKCEKFREKINVKTNSKVMIHGLLKCKTCKVLWNRDENSSNNIYKISKCAINGNIRPPYLSRTKKKLLIMPRPHNK